MISYWLCMWIQKENEKNIEDVYVDKKNNKTCNNLQLMTIYLNWTFPLPQRLIIIRLSNDSLIILSTLKWTTMTISLTIDAFLYSECARCMHLWTLINIQQFTHSMSKIFNTIGSTMNYVCRMQSLCLFFRHGNWSKNNNSMLNASVNTCWIHFSPLQTENYSSRQLPLGSFGYDVCGDFSSWFFSKIIF